ncbi:MAG: TIGR03936 family radical SAM-associated protein [Acidimicrobiales bacterium]|nr:TIGR03936 family radical SAM-associated protein [Acidimicrobiales bacterium]
MSENLNRRIRIAFDKHGKIRFTSHRDVARIWERTLRRASLPVAYSEGFSPRPKLSFGLALSTGHESDAEYLDVELDPDRVPEDLDLDALATDLSERLPVGMTVSAVTFIERSTPSLQQAVTSCTWQIDVVDVDADTVAGAVARALAAEDLIVTRERKGKEVTDDLRPLVLSLDVIGPTGDANDADSVIGVRLLAELGTQPRAVRVSELLAALDPPLTERRVVRLHQWIQSDDTDERSDPLSAAVSPAPAGAS